MNRPAAYPHGKAKLQPEIVLPAPVHHAVRARDIDIEVQDAADAQEDRELICSGTAEKTTRIVSRAEASTRHNPRAYRTWPSNIDRAQRSGYLREVQQRVAHE